MACTASGCRWSIFDHEPIEIRPGFLSFRVTGKKAAKLFAHEGGGHRWQRVPPTEKRGRVQTSTITVAVLEEPKEYELRIDPKDIDESFIRGSGAGGQHRNKTDTAVLLKHKPSGIAVRVDGGRSQHTNRLTALNVLRAKLKARIDAETSSARVRERRQQVGTGLRGDKVRTIAVQRDSVVDHVTGKAISFREFSRGRLRGLFR